MGTEFRNATADITILDQLATGGPSDEPQNLFEAI
jgi:hypothetical protein